MQTLGLPQGADSKRVEAAYRQKRREAEVNGDKAALKSIEEAHNALFMSSLSSRLSVRSLRVARCARSPQKSQGLSGLLVGDESRQAANWYRKLCIPGRALSVAGGGLPSTAHVRLQPRLDRAKLDSPKISMIRSSGPC